MTQTLSKTEAIQIIEKAYKVMNEQNSFRSFLSIGRDSLQAEWFNARGITDKWDCHYTTFFKSFFTEGEKYFIGDLFEEQYLHSFAIALSERLNGSLNTEPKVKGEEVAAPQIEVSRTQDIKTERNRHQQCLILCCHWMKW
jgi:hypothetical protein